MAEKIAGDFGPRVDPTKEREARDAADAVASGWARAGQATNMHSKPQEVRGRVPSTWTCTTPSAIEHGLNRKLAVLLMVNGSPHLSLRRYIEGKFA